MKYDAEKLVKTEHSCGCFSFTDKETGKPVNQYFCGRHMGLLPRFNDFHPITNKINEKTN